MNPLWKVFSNFYSKPAFPPPPPSLVWSGADTRSNHRPGWMRDPEACGKVPGTTSVDQEPTVSCPSSGLGVRHAVKAISITSSMLQHEWVGSPAAAPDTEQISACTPHCWGPVDMFLHRSGEYLMSIGKVDQNIWALWHYGTSKSSVVVFQHNGIRWFNIRGELYWYSKRHHQQIAY